MAVSRADHQALLDKIRKKMKQKSGGFQRDPAEFRPPQVGVKDPQWKAKLFILPPLEKGDSCAGGKTFEGDMDDLFYIQVGDHWINRKKYPCPRVYDGDECPMCNFGFQLLSETDDKQTRKKIASLYLPRTQYSVNIYFPDVKTNPEDVRDKVLFYALPKTIFDKLDTCLIRNDGGDEDDPQAWGIFYAPSEAYPLILKIGHQGGYNDYKESSLSAKLQPIAKGQKKIDEVLAMRHDLISKYPERTPENLAKLQKMVNDLMNPDGGDTSTSTSTSTSETSSDSDSGFDADETQTPTEPETEQAAPAAEEDDSDEADGLAALLDKIESGEE